jgi:hypothetical protein
LLRATPFSQTHRHNDRGESGLALGRNNLSGPFIHSDRPNGLWFDW